MKGEAFGQRPPEFLGFVAISGVIAAVLSRCGRMQRVMDIVVPLRRVAAAAPAPVPRQPPCLVLLILQNQVYLSSRNRAANSLR